MQIFKATLETRNFSFEAYSEVSQATATLKLMDTLAKHGKQYKCEPCWYGEFLEDMKLQTIELGVGYRDGEKL